jgi:serine/threonine-protein kinase
MIVNPCDPQRIDLLVNNRLSRVYQQEMEEHLLKCAACRKKLDDLAGGASWEAEVQRFLVADSDEELGPTWDEIAPSRAAAIELDFLEAPTDEATLGNLGVYRVLEVIGQGGMGIVLKARDPALNRLVAIKVLAREHAGRSAARKRFAREAQAAAAVVHDHVVAVHAVDADATPPYLVMAFIPGQSLQQRIDRTGPLAIAEVLRIGQQTASGLAAAHAQGLVHRDIKPANIMLENGVERVRITDFGLARAMDDASVTQHGLVAGTPQYMAPEQARGETIDQRADLFALGSVIYTMATGRAPFTGENGLSVIRQVCDAEPRSMYEMNVDVPAWLEGIVGKLHAKDPARRFQTAGEVSELLQDCLAHVHDPRGRPLPAAARRLARGYLRRGRMPGGWKQWAIVAACVSVMGMSGYMIATKRLGWRATPVASADAGPVEAEAVPTMALAEMESDYHRRSQEVRLHMKQLQVSLIPASPDDSVGQASRQARQAVQWISSRVAARAEVERDPVAEEIEALRQRLAAIRDEMNRIPD